MKYYFLLLLTVLIFFNPVFRGLMPFPGDLLINENPYRTESFLGYNPGSYPNKAQGQDVLTEMYPWKYFAIQQLKSGQIPFWNPYNFSGNNLLANFQSAVFYPLNLFYFILPFNAAWALLIILEPFLAAIFMFIFLTKSLKLSPFSGFIGAFAFAFSSYMTVWLEWGNIGHTLLWLPLVLFLVKKVSEKITVITFVLLVAVLVLSFLAGYIQGFFYLYIFSILYFIYSLGLKNIKKNTKKISYFILALILPILLSSFQLLSTLHLFLNSTRGGYSLSQISNLLLPVYYWVTAFASDFFGNPATRNYWTAGTYIERVMYISVPLLFFAFISLKSKTKEKKFFLISGVLSLILATNLPLIKYLYLIPIPVISTTVPTRELSVFIFSAITLGSIGINYWEKESIKTKIPWIFLSIYFLLFLIVFILWKINFLPSQNFSITLRNLLIPFFLALLTVLIFKGMKNKFGKFVLIVIVLFDLFYFLNKITPFSPTEFIYPNTPVMNFLQKNAGINRFWGYGSAYINSNFQTFDRTFSPEGNDPLHIYSYGVLLASTSNGKIPKILPRPDANIAPGYGSSDLASNFYRQRILNLLGVKYILNQSGTRDYDSAFPPEKYKLVWQSTPWQIYENKEVLPRFFLFNDYKVYNNDQEVISAIYDRNINLTKTLLLKSTPNIIIDKKSINSVRLLSYEPNRVVFQTETSGNSLLFLSDNYYSQWQGLVDGKSTKVLLADYTFRVISVPKGKHKVEFFYSSEYLSAGLKISLISFIALLFFIVAIKRNEKA